MATDYPGAIDSSSKLPNPSASSATNSPSHAGLHDNENDAIIATETKLGTGASTPTNNTLLIGTGTGTSSWSAVTSAQLAARISDETGSGSAVFGTTPTLVTPKVDTINEATVGNGTSVNGVLLKSSKMNASYLTDSSLASAQLGTGMVAQIVSTNFSAVATGTTTIPFDDTIPQITEGDQYMTQTITPKSATNILVIEVVFYGANSAANDIQIALFQDATANALAANSTYNATATARLILPLTHTMTAGTTSSTTFRLRAGSNGAGTITFNGVSAARLYGAITKSSMKITEYKA